MHYSPYKFEAPWHAFEFAFHILEVESNLVIISMAWMTREEPRRFSRMSNEPDMDTLTYWVTRLEPLIRAESKEEIVVVFCNRTGSEGDATYAGTSAVIGIHDGQVKVYGLLGRGAKELLVVDTNETPYAKLIHRPTLVHHSQAVPIEKPIIPEGTSIIAGALETSDASAVNSATGSNPSTNAMANGNTLPLREENLQQSQQAHSTPSKVKRKPSEPIIIPNTSGPVLSTNALQSPGAESATVPTPSAPSPVPMVLRPKLIIPQSPPINPQQYVSDVPISALSQQSEQSVHSIRSVMSDESTQTIRSNPRPPEDSTPYPHSGAPLSGYPIGGRNKIYGGFVSINQLDNFSPTTPFSEVSPISPSWQWKQPDSAIRTPLSAAAWGPGTPIGRQPEPFPWPIITGNINAKTNPPVSEAANAVPLTAIEHNDILTAVEDPRPNETTDPFPARPSSPKSRNASRSRMRERSNSTASNRDHQATITHHLGEIAQRIRSASAARDASTTRNGTARRQSLSRNSHRVPTPGLQRAATPSEKLDERGAPIVPTPAAFDYYRQAASDNKIRRRNSFSTSMDHQSISSASEVPRPAHRQPSRGRQPGPAQAHDNEKKTIRPTSADSTRNAVLHRRESKRGRRSMSNQAGRKASRTATSRNARGSSQNTREFERIESIRCPSCPVHSQRPESAQTVRPVAPIHTVSLTRPANEIQPARVKQIQASAAEVQTSKSDGSSKKRIPTSVPGRPTTAPPLFDPVTPKAMTFDHGETAWYLSPLASPPVDLHGAMLPPIDFRAEAST